MLDTTCNRLVVHGLSDGAGRIATGVSRPDRRILLHAADMQNFGKINLKRGRRVIEFVLKYYF